jgi:SAM-dependent methyltransferase
VKVNQEYRHNQAEAHQRSNPSLFHSRYYYLKQLRALVEYAHDRYLKGGEVLVDYGCGSMPYRSLFLDKVQSYRGADLSDNPQIEIALDEHGRMLCEDSSTDLVLSTQVLEHVDDPNLYLGEAHRVLKADGLLLLTTHGYWMYHPDPYDYWRWTSAGLKKIVAANGFEVVDFKGIIGRSAMGLQLFQDGLYFKVPKFVKPIFVFIMQLFIHLFDKTTKQSTKDTDACTFLIVAKAIKK